MKITKLTRKLVLICICTAVSIAAGLVYLLVASPIYEAEARLYIKESQPMPMQPAALVNDRNFIATQAEIIRSPLIVARALKTTPIALPANFEGDATTFALEKMSVAPVIDTDVVSIGFRSNSQEEAVSFVQSLVASYQGLLRNLETVDNGETLELLTNREEELRNELAELNNQHIKLREGSQLVGQSREAVNVYSTMLDELAQKLTDTRLKKIELAGLMDSLTASDAKAAYTSTVENSSAPENATGTVKVNVTTKTAVHNLILADLFRDQTDLGSRSITDLESQLVSARIRSQHLGSKFGEKHIEAKIAKEEVEELEGLFEQRLETLAESVSRQYVGIKQSEIDLEKLYSTEQQKVKALDSFLIQDEKIRVQIERTELIYDTLLTRLSEIQLTDQALANGQSSVIVRDLQDAKITPVLIWPQKKAFLAICAMVGMGGGFLLTFGVEAMRQKSSTLD